MLTLSRPIRRSPVRLLPTAYCLLLSALCLLPSAARAQEVVDRMVAVINGRELITHTDLLWQLALQPDVPLDNPRPEDLQRALQLVLDQRLISQEAEKLPTIQPTDKEIQDELKDLIGRFPSNEEFYRRLARVGLGENSDQLREIVRQRVAIEKYVSFRFRAFTVVTPQEVADYYRDVWSPRRRRASPGAVVPKLEEVYARVESELREEKVASDTDEFLEDARASAEIVILDEGPGAGGQGPEGRGTEGRVPSAGGRVPGQSSPPSRPNTSSPSSSSPSPPSPSATSPSSPSSPSSSSSSPAPGPQPPTPVP